MNGITFSLVPVADEISPNKKVYRAYVKTNGTVDKEALAEKTGQDISLANYFLDALYEFAAERIAASCRRSRRASPPATRSGTACERMRRDNAAVKRIANGNHELPVPHLAADHGGESPTALTLASVAGTAAADLRPAPSGRRLVAPVTVLMSGDHDLHAVPLEDRTPELRAVPAPVGPILQQIARIGLRIRIVKRNVAEDDDMRRLRDLRTAKLVVQPLRLQLAVGGEGRTAGEARMPVGLVLAGVEADEGDVTLTDREIADEGRILRITLRRQKKPFPK